MKESRNHLRNGKKLRKWALRKWWSKHVDQYSVSWGRRLAWSFCSGVQVTIPFALPIIKIHYFHIFIVFYSVRKWHWIKVRTLILQKSVFWWIFIRDTGEKSYVPSSRIMHVLIDRVIVCIQFFQFYRPCCKGSLRKWLKSSGQKFSNKNCKI